MGTLREEIQGFLSDEEKQFAETTRVSYGNILGRLASWLETEKQDFDTLTLKSAKDWITDQGWGETLTYSAHVCIRSFVVWRSGRTHPLAKLRIRKPGLSLQRTLTAHQASVLLSSLASGSRPENIRNLAMCALALDTGLRASELCRLKNARLDIDKRQLSVLGKGSKGGKWRSCVFTFQTAGYLTAWLKTRETVTGADATSVFVSVNGKTKGRHLTTGGLRAIFRKIGRKAGLEGLSPHDLRRTMATLGIENGAPSRMIQQQGGWASLDLVERYTQALSARNVEKFLPGGFIKVMCPDVSFTDLQTDEARSAENLAAITEICGDVIDLTTPPYFTKTIYLP